MTKPYVIKAEYLTQIDFNIPDIEKKHNLDWGSVDTYYVKWGELVITLKDGTNLTIPPEHEPTDIDYKRPNDVIEYNEKYEVINEN